MINKKLSIMANLNINKANSLAFGQRVKIAGNNFSENPLLTWGEELKEQSKNAKNSSPVLMSKAIRKQAESQITERVNVVNEYSGSIDRFSGEVEELKLNQTAPPIPQKCSGLTQQLADYKDWQASMASPVMIRKFTPQIKELHSEVMDKNVDSPEFIDSVIKMNEFWGNNTEIEMNTQRIKDIAKSDDNYIFIMNHDCPEPMSYGFYSELYKEYKELGKESDCPRPKYVISERFVNSLPEKLKQAFIKVEAVPVDATAYPTGERAKSNAKIMGPVRDGFNEGKNHILIFPEGNRYRIKNMSPLDKFQYGISKIVLDALNQKDTVKIASLGGSAKDGLSSLNIGADLCFKKIDDVIYVNKGNLTADKLPENCDEFLLKLANCNDEEFLPITWNGEPLEINDKESQKLALRLIAGIMCNDLQISRQDSINKLNKELDG